MITRDEREEGCSHTNGLRRSCKDDRGRGSIERHEILELRACQVPVAACMKHDAADARQRMRGPTRALRCFRSLVLGGLARSSRDCLQAVWGLDRWLVKPPALPKHPSQSLWSPRQTPEQRLLRACATGPI
jgi:hypothetical protein